MPLDVYYKEAIVGKYYPDILVDECVLLELKAVSTLAPIHSAQLLNALKASDLKLGLVFNFGLPRIEFKRVVNGL